MSTILVIDDQCHVRSTLRAILELEAYDVLEADHGETGLRIMSRHNVDLVVTDVLMPEMDGIETIIELRRNYPDVKVVAISGGGRMKNLRFLNIAQSIGANEVLAKPFRPKELLSVIGTLLQSDVA